MPIVELAVASIVAPVKPFIVTAVSPPYPPTPCFSEAVVVGCVV